MTIALPRALPGPDKRFFDREGKPTREYYQYARDLDAAIRAVIEVVNTEHP